MPYKVLEAKTRKEMEDKLNREEGNGYALEQINYEISNDHRTPPMRLVAVMQKPTEPAS